VVELGVELGAGVEAGALGVLSLEVDEALLSAGAEVLAESDAGAEADSDAGAELLAA
jgi:hypothetical protein